MWHYHGPGGLNGRVRDGNGCGPAGMVAEKAAARRSGRAAAGLAAGSVTVRVVCRANHSRTSTPYQSELRRSDVGGETLLKARAIVPGRSASGEAGGGSGWSSARLLGLVRCGARAPCTPSPSTWSSSRSLHSLRYWKPRLGGGFALRCLQRLSGPDLATRRCPERDSRHTRGRSSPILSY